MKWHKIRKHLYLYGDEIDGNLSFLQAIVTKIAPDRWKCEIVSDKAISIRNTLPEAKQFVETYLGAEDAI